MRKQISKRISAVVASCILLGSTVMPVQAEEQMIGEAYSTVSQEEGAAAESSAAVLPEGLEEAAATAEAAYEAAAARAATYDAKAVQMNEYEWGVLYLTNKVRMQNGLQPLSTDANLQRAAGIRKEEIITLFSHTRPNGKDCFSALEECGVPYGPAGENIASGQINPVSVITGWWNSPGHRMNMLNSSFTHMGTGFTYPVNNIYARYWVQLFTGECTPDAIRLNLDNTVPYIITNDMSIDELGFELIIDCSHGTYYMPVIEEMCTPVDMNLINQDQTITISYAGKTTNIILRVQEKLPFEDVWSEAWYFPYVAEAYYNGIMTGLDRTHFGPTEPLARAQFAIILHRLMDEPQVEYKDTFPDVAEGQWFTPAILWASSEGIVSGYGDSGLFGPGDNINREQMAVMMYRFAEYLGMDTSGRADISHFADAAKVNEFAQEAMSWANYNGIITGKSDNTIDPQGNAIRAECATIIMRFLEYCGL